ncbi:MAG: bacillithiol biosynthesis cysteine-adding enzyme BshC [Chlorobi bacterium]|nr:bacillithiol biosynthesis cysteine-adding enzyme BshC [Chlorobiota bacterium]MCI0717218.1 bacillithiol biosynthesis cysteine-adding enzyme BshC [Chlorobiota bacterium]
MYPVEYSKLPSFNNLFLDYISNGEEDYLKLKTFFYSHFRENEEFFKVIDDKIHNYNTNRYFDKNILIDILKQQNVTFGGNENTAQHIELLKNEETFAVVTGQQVGLYTGPLYTILKTITSIKLAKNLKERFPQFNFVPVFWLESEDHDFEEANHINIIDQQNELVRIGFEKQSDDEEDSKKSLVPVGSIKFDEMINSINEELRSNLLDTDFKDKIMDLITSLYKTGGDFKTAFAKMMNELFKDYGVVFIDPSDAEVKRLLSPIFEKELTTSPRLCESIITTSAEIEKNYDLQVKPKVINIFFLHNGNRLLIEPRDEGKFALRNSKRRFESGELTNILQESPELFSPNVVLRPICQDYLLPTIAYVGGPGEISYFAQLKPAYNHYEITMPVIFPRASVTIVEGKISKFLNNFNVKFEDIFHHSFMVSKVVEKLSEVRVDDEISKYQDEFSKIFYEMRNMTVKVDQTLLNAVDNIKEKTKQSLEQFKGKLINSQARKSDTAATQIDKVTNNIYPKNHLQERVINVTYFLNKYDYGFISRLFHEIDVLNFNHQIIEM